jgi:hypothetical protein
MYGMRKTTLYLPDELKADLENLSVSSGCSEAEIVRRAVEGEVARATPPRPRLPITQKPLGDPSLAENIDRLLEGFGRH